MSIVNSYCLYEYQALLVAFVVVDTAALLFVILRLFQFAVRAL